jgi:hypothetical protein
MTSDQNDSSPARRPLTDEEIALGVQAQRWVQRFVVGCFVAVMTVALVVFTQVPLSTTVSCTRLSNDFQIPVWALLLIPLVLVIIWRKGRGPNAGHMPKSERIVMIVLAVVYLLFSTVGQIFMASFYLEAAGRI